MRKKPLINAVQAGKRSDDGSADMMKIPRTEVLGI
jgi:hypothetical protein